MCESVFAVSISALSGGFHCFQSLRRKKKCEFVYSLDSNSETSKTQRERERDKAREGYALYPGNDGGERRREEGRQKRARGMGGRVRRRNRPTIARRERERHSERREEEGSERARDGEIVGPS